MRQRIRSVLPLSKQSKSKLKQWGVTKLGPGEKHLRTDLLKVDATAGTATGPAASMLYAAHFSDVHVLDEESPARSINADVIVSPAWRAQEAHATQVLDAMVRKVIKFHALRQVDFVALTGDCIDNNQKNELDWFVKVLEGGKVTPNSGKLEDPVSGAGNDPHDTFTAAGLGKIPWFVAHGNHDGLVQGNFPKLSLLGYSVLMGNPTRNKIGVVELGRVNPPACNTIPAGAAPSPKRCIPTASTKLKSGSLTADKQRKHLTRQGWLEAVFDAGGQPKNHGLTYSHVSKGRGDFSANPVAGLPLRLIMLDTCAPAIAEGAYSSSTISSFLQPALKQAQADQVLVVVASHHPSSSILGTGSKLRQTLNGFPNVLLHLVGHGHKNRVWARSGTSPAHGYWEVETSSLMDWPQQGRLVELVDNRDGTGELWLTLFDYDTDHKPLGQVVQGARFLALDEVHAGASKGASSAEGKAFDRNVVLPVHIPAAVAKKLALIKGKPIESKLFK